MGWTSVRRILRSPASPSHPTAPQASGFNKQERESAELRPAGTGGPREERGRLGGKGREKKKTREGGWGSFTGGALSDWFQLNQEPPILMIRVRLLRSSASPSHPTAPQAPGFNKQERDSAELRPAGTGGPRGERGR